MSHDLLIHAVVDKTERACIFSRRWERKKKTGRKEIEKGEKEGEEEEEEEEEALNQFVISFRESHNSASYHSFGTV